MKLFAFRFPVMIILMALFACNKGAYLFSDYPISGKKKLSKKVSRYTHDYGRIDNATDTVIIKEKTCSVYKDGLLYKLGDLNKDNQPVGYWVIFNNHLNAEYIIHYRNDKVDSIPCRLGVVEHSRF